MLDSFKEIPFKNNKFKILNYFLRLRTQGVLSAFEKINNNKDLIKCWIVLLSAERSIESY